jgi:hypothetical protein
MFWIRPMLYCVTHFVLNIKKDSEPNWPTIRETLCEWPIRIYFIIPPLSQKATDYIKNTVQTVAPQEREKRRECSDCLTTIRTWYVCSLVLQRMANGLISSAAETGMNIMKCQASRPTHFLTGKSTSTIRKWWKINTGFHKLIRGFVHCRFITPSSDVTEMGGCFRDRARPWSYGLCTAWPVSGPEYST